MTTDETAKIILQQLRETERIALQLQNTEQTIANINTEISRITDEEAKVATAKNGFRQIMQAQQLGIQFMNSVSATQRMLDTVDLDNADPVILEEIKEVSSNIDVVAPAQ